MVISFTGHVVLPAQQVEGPIPEGHADLGLRVHLLLQLAVVLCQAGHALHSMRRDGTVRASKGWMDGGKPNRGMREMGGRVFGLGSTKLSGTIGMEGCSAFVR